MDKETFEEIIIETAKLSGSDMITVVGSQALHAVFESLPDIAILSNEVDVLFDKRDIAEKVDLELGEHSEFHAKWFCYVHALDPCADLPFPLGWRSNAISKQINREGISTECLFMAPEDLCASKLAVGRAKDLEFVANLVERALIETAAIRERIARLPEDYQKSDAEYMLGKVISHDLEFGGGFGF